jgi:hypothetical protein
MKILFSENKNLFSCGFNEINQKGIFKYQNLKSPTKLEFFKDIEIENIFTGYYGTFIKTKSYLFFKNIKNLKFKNRKFNLLCRR